MKKTKSLFDFIYDLMRRRPLHALFILFLLVIQAVFVTVALVSIAPVIDLYQSPDLESATSLTIRIVGILESLSLPVNLKTLALVLIGITAVKNVALICIQYLLLKVQLSITAELSLTALKAIFATSWSYYAQLNQGVLLNTFTVELNRIWQMFYLVSRQIVNINQVLILSIVALAVSWQVTLISLFIASVFLLPLLSFSKRLNKLGKDNTDVSNEFASNLKEIVDGAKVIRGFGAEKKAIERYRAIFDSYRSINVSWRTLSFSQNMLNEPLGMLTLVVTLWMVDRYEIPTSSAIVAIWSIKSLLPVLTDTVSYRNIINGLIPSYDHVLNIRARALEAKLVTGSLSFDGFKRSLKVESLTFNYSNCLDSTPVLNGIDFQVEKGSTIAFVGRSGSGKSTLVDLLMGMNQPTDGVVLLDGVDLKEYDLASYRRFIGFVPQDPLLFNCSILDNIKFAKPDATVGEVEEAIRNAYAEEFVSSLPEGLNTTVGDRGLRLSGGQGQRLALARALVHRPQILFLDEATSALDSKSENFVKKAIKNIGERRGDITIISITHRLSTITNADQIYVMHNGEIVESGTHDELIRLDGHLVDMMKS